MDAWVFWPNPGSWATLPAVHACARAAGFSMPSCFHSALTFLGPMPLSSRMSRTPWGVLAMSSSQRCRVPVVLISWISVARLLGRPGSVFNAWRLRWARSCWVFSKSRAAWL